MAQPHLVRRGPIFYWRRRVPLSLAGRLPRQFALSLKTGDARRARLAARAPSAAADRIFVLMSRAPLSPSADAFLLARLNRRLNADFGLDLPTDAAALEKRFPAVGFEQSVRTALKHTAQALALDETETPTVVPDPLPSGAAPRRPADLVQRVTEILVRDHRADIVALADMPQSDRTVQERFIHLHHDLLRQAVARRDDTWLAEPVDLALADLGLPADPESLEFRLLCQDVLLALEARLDDLVRYLPAPAAAEPRLGATAAAAAAPPVPATPPPAAASEPTAAGTAAPSGPTVAEAFEIYARQFRLGRDRRGDANAKAVRRCGGQRIAENAAGDAKALRDLDWAVRFITAFFGDTPVASFSSADAFHLRDQMERMPSLNGKGVYKGLAIPDQIARREEIRLVLDGEDASPHLTDPDRRRKEMQAEVLQGKTINKHLSTLRRAFGSFRERQLYAGANPFDHTSISKKELARNRTGSRTSWTPDQVRGLLASPLYAGCHSHQWRAKPGDHVVRDGLYYAPLLALYGGLCAEEIARLRPGDLLHQDGMLILDIVPGPNRTLKTEGRSRLVPVHASLVEHGLVEYAARQQETGAEWLFPDLAAKVGTLSDRFGYYRVAALGLRPGDFVDFHALRHTFINKVKHFVTPLQMNMLIGHAARGTVREYLHDHPEDLPPLHDAVQKIRHP